MYIYVCVCACKNYIGMNILYMYSSKYILYIYIYIYIYICVCVCAFIYLHKRSGNICHEPGWVFGAMKMPLQGSTPHRLGLLPPYWPPKTTVGSKKKG